jgi:hypothetical protein
MNLLLIPVSGIRGAAVANTVAYAVLAAVAWHFSQRFYPMPYERGRLARVLLAGVAAFVVGHWLPLDVRPLWGVLIRGTVVVAVFPTVLLAIGFFIPHELQRLDAVTARLRRRRTIEAPVEAADLAGEVVAAPLSDAAEDAGDEAPAVARSASGPPARERIE